MSAKRTQRSGHLFAGGILMGCHVIILMFQILCSQQKSNSVSLIILYQCMNQSEEENNKDGFESDNDLDQQELEPALQPFGSQLRTKNEEIYYSLPPGQGIAAKKYSLYPDIITGWKPRKNRSHPIPISVDSPYFDQLFDRILKHPSQKMRVCYYGPRYDNTYFAWHQMPFDFPYSHIEPPNNMKFTNRPFCGHHPDLSEDIIFDSYFQNGNLDCAIQVDRYEYDLYMRVDSNTRGHFLWYNFKAKNMAKNVKYKFNICNMQKDTSLYSRGMKPFILSQKAKDKLGRQWMQQGQNIKYQKKASKSLSVMDSRSKQFYQLSFQYSTIYDNDTVHIAYSIPYTLTDLRIFLDSTRKRLQKSRFYFEEKLCMSLGGLPIPLVTINDEPGDQSPEKKKCIVIVGRVHPGQSNSSFLMTGLIDFLTSHKKNAKHIRSKVIFKIVPMLNPDGVCFGNYRTGLSGKDFNRQYLNPDAVVFPQIYSLKKLIGQYKKKFGSNFMMFVDLHGHSVKKNIFMYGPQFNIMDRFYYESRIFPRILSKRTPMFRYYSCVFKIEDIKKNTARAIFQRNFNIPLSYTIEASNGSYYDTQLLKDVSFNESMWVQMGTQIGMGLSEYTSIMQTSELARIKKMKMIQERRIRSHNKIKQETNLRTSRLVERKKDKKKNRLQLQARNFQPIEGDQDDVDDMLRYIYEEIEQAELHKKKVQKNLGQFNSKDYLGVDPEDLIEGDSDHESEGNDLEEEKLKLLYSNIKRKKLPSTNERQQSGLGNKSQDNDNSSTEYRLKFTNRRVFSALGSRQQEYCKKLSQPKKTAKINIDFDIPNKSPEEVKKKFPFANERKEQPKTFEEFVSSCKYWQRMNKSAMENPSNSVTIHRTIRRDVEVTGSNSPNKIRLSMYEKQKRKDSGKNNIVPNPNAHRRYHHRSSSAKVSSYFLKN